MNIKIRRRVKHPVKYINRLVPGTMLAAQGRDKLIRIFYNKSFSAPVRRAARRELAKLRVYCESQVIYKIIIPQDERKSVI